MVAAMVLVAMRLALTVVVAIVLVPVDSRVYGQPFKLV